MSNVYISTKGQLSKCDQHFVFKDYQGKCVSILPINTDKFILCNSVSITGEAFWLLSKYKIPVSIKTGGNNENISIQYEDEKNVFLKQTQYRLMEDKSKSLEISKAIVLGKIKNQLAFIQRIKRTLKDADQKSQITEAAEEIKKTLGMVQRCKSVQALRGLEGLTARYYFSVLKLHIKPEWAVFEKRSKNPPETNVNAVLSFLYYLLAEEVELALQSEGFDCMAGVLHEIQYGRKSLVYDLMEEFRTPFADVICCRLFNHKILNEEDFIQEGKAVYLTRDSMKKVIAEFEEKMSQKIKIGDNEITCRDLIFRQAENFKKVLTEKEEIYKPYQYK